MCETNGSFICPECGHTKTGETKFVSITPAKNNPWSSVLQIMTCGRCWSRIPAHIGERWDGMTEEEAKVQWKTVYREKGRR